MHKPSKAILPISYWQLRDLESSPVIGTHHEEEPQTWSECLAKRPSSNVQLFPLLFWFSQKINQKVNSSRLTSKQMDSLRNEHETKTAKCFYKKYPAKPTTVMWHRSNRQCPAQMAGPGVTSAPTIAGKANGYTGAATDGKTQGRAGVPAPGVGGRSQRLNLIVRLPCSQHSARQHCSHRTAMKEGLKAQWMPKWQYPQKAVPT